MTSKAERKRQTKARTIARTAEAKVMVANDEPMTLAPKPEPDGLGELVELRKARGEHITRSARNPGERDTNDRPFVRMTGLMWLASRKPARITRAQHAAGLKYGDYYRLATCEAVLGSQLGSRDGGGDPTLQSIVDRADKRAHAIQQLAQARAVLCWQKSAIKALDLICGEEKRCAEVCKTDREAVAMEAILLVALDQLTTFWGLEARVKTTA